MKKKYYVNRKAQDNGDHEVHEDTCMWMPAPENQPYLGEFTHCITAVAAAKGYYRQANGCIQCSNACHTQ